MATELDPLVAPDGLAKLWAADVVVTRPLNLADVLAGPKAGEPVINDDSLGS